MSVMILKSFGNACEHFEVTLRQESTLCLGGYLFTFKADVVCNGLFLQNKGETVLWTEVTERGCLKNNAHIPGK